MVIGELPSERKRMESYWKERSGDTTIESMMLDTNAALLTQHEVPEVLSRLPDFANHDVLELASGIGRYTVEFAPKVNSLTAVEFIEEFHLKNKSHHENHDHLTFLCEDVTKLSLPSTSYDLIFSNWLLMYFGDVEVQQFAMNALKWMKPYGHLFFRESCFKKSGDVVSPSSNPTHYRHPGFYVGTFESACIREDDGQMSYFELVSSGSVEAYRKFKQNNGQVYFLWKKVTKPYNEDTCRSFQNFLDNQQYSVQSITRYEKIFGEGYISTGGPQTTHEFVRMMNLKPSDRILDVGCGIGGGDFYMAEEFGSSVVAIDLSTNMVHVALERSMEKAHLDVQFEICDATTKTYAPESFDVIYSRDAILHIEDKEALFSKFLTWLKPNGRLLISDYCCGEQEATPHFKEYVKGRGYHLLSPPHYGHLLEKVGFTDVNAMDKTDLFVASLRRELQWTKDNKDSFISETSEKDFNDIVNGWESKLVRASEGDQRWGLFTAVKPAA